MNKKAFIFLGFVIYSILQTFIIFANVPSNKFLFIGDQFIRFSEQEINRNAFYIRKMENFGVFNAWQLTVQTPDILYYSLVYKLGLDIRSSEILLTALILTITLSLSFIGFSKLEKLFFSKRNLGLILAITFWHSMNPYLMVMWHGAIYNFGSSITYSLAPLILYYFHIAINDSKALKERIICAILMFLASFTFWMFAAIAFFLILYLVGYLIVNKHTIVPAILNLLKLGAFYIPLCAMIIYPILHEYFNNKADVNGTFYATFGQIKGSILYQALMYFSWGIYNMWTPRSIYPPVITNFYFSPFYILATLGLYALLFAPIYLIYRENSALKLTQIFKKNYYPLIFLCIFFISIFLAKGKEPPFGWIFLFLYNHVPFFSVFRSSDHRFGFPAVLSLSILFLILLPKIKNSKIVIVSLIAITIIQNFIFFNSSLIIGQNKDNEYYDRIVEIPESYKELTNFLQNDKETSYVFPYPSVEYGTYNLTEDEVHIGQDILAKVSSKSFAYIPVTSGMAIPTAQVLVASINNKNLDILKLLPIKYILMRKDTSCADCPEISEDMLNGKTTNVFSNDNFTLYELNDHAAIINSTSPVVQKIISPVKLEAYINNVSGPAIINLMQSYNPSWDLYIDKYSEPCEDATPINERSKECNSRISLINFSDLFLPGKTGISSRAYPENFTHTNNWNIEATQIASSLDQSYYHRNEDGTYNFKFTIFYTPQRNYLWSIVITLASFLVSIGILLKLRFKSD